MGDCTIELLDDLPENMEEKMRKDLVAYETSNGVDLNYQKFSFTLVTKSGQAFGVLNAYTVFAEVYIDDLWVDVSSRGRGYGRKLMQALEDIRGEMARLRRSVGRGIRLPDRGKQAAACARTIRPLVETFAADRGTLPSSLETEDRSELMRFLIDHREVRQECGSAELIKDTVSLLLGPAEN